LFTRYLALAEGTRSDPKTITSEEYERFYEATFRDYEKPLAWHHFSGDSGSGVSFKAIIFVPSHL
jgi:heat shock protein beta